MPFLFHLSIFAAILIFYQKISYLVRLKIVLPWLRCLYKYLMAGMLESVDLIFKKFLEVCGAMKTSHPTGFL